MCWNAEIIKRKRDKGEDDFENDGLVSIASAKWGQYIETGEGEHFAETSTGEYKGKTIWRDVFTPIIRHLQTLP